MRRTLRNPGLFTLAVLALALAVSGIPPSANAADPDKGKISYTTYCVMCHGEIGDGKGPVGVTLDPKPRDLSRGEFKFDPDKDGRTGTDADLAAVIKNGAAAFGGSPLMTPWAHLQEVEIQDLVAYIRLLEQAGTAAAKTDDSTTP
jgi:mono/diheme cytochrome c family protein